MSIKCLIFDLDQTLVDSEKAYAYGERSVDIKPDSLTWKMAKINVKDRLPKNHSSSHNRCLYFSEWLQLKEEFSATLVLDVIGTYEAALFAEISRQVVELRRHSLLERISKKFKLCIMTNEVKRTQLLKLKAIDPDGLFFFRMFTSEDFGFEKPDVKFFASVCKELGANFNECMMIGDHFENDIAPARDLGMQCILTNEFNLSKQSAHIGVDVKQIKSLEELCLILSC